MEKITVNTPKGKAVLELNGDFATVQLEGKEYSLKYDLDLDVYLCDEIDPVVLDLINEAINS